MELSLQQRQLIRHVAKWKTRPPQALPENLWHDLTEIIKVLEHNASCHRDEVDDLRDKLISTRDGLADDLLDERGLRVEVEFDRDELLDAVEFALPLAEKAAPKEIEIQYRLKDCQTIVRRCRRDRGQMRKRVREMGDKKPERSGDNIT